MDIIEKNCKKRISYINFLKFIGITCIIIAHSGAPSWLMMLRSFDVPLMVILSAFLCAKSFKKNKGNNLSISDYYIKRVKRLVVPTWLFLIIYFSLSYISTGHSYDFQYYIASFCLTRYGIGYVWIILIYLYSSLLIPLYSKIKTYKASVVCVIAVYILYEILYYFKVGTNNAIVDTTFYYIVPYGVLTYLGYYYSHAKRPHKTGIILISFVLFVTMGIYYWIKTGAPQLVQIAKYPARIYYLSFGIMVSSILLQICEKVELKIFDSNFVRYISEHSMWIYLWHILVLTLYNAIGLPQIWYIKFSTVYFTSVFIVFVFNKILDLVKNKKIQKLFTYFRG